MTTTPFGIHKPAQARHNIDLRLIVVADRVLAGERGVAAIVQAAVEAGAPAIQLRDKQASARELFEQALILLAIVRPHGALLFINDRVDVAIAVDADGAHVGPDDLPLAAARHIAPPGFLLGFSTDDPARAQQAAADGADYIGCGAVFGTTSKLDAGEERIGTAALDRVATGVSIPVVGIGGINEANVADVAATRAAGVAVIGAVMSAPDPGAAVSRILAAFDR